MSSISRERAREREREKREREVRDAIYSPLGSDVFHLDRQVCAASASASASASACGACRRVSPVLKSLICSDSDATFWGGIILHTHTYAHRLTNTHTHTHHACTHTQREQEQEQLVQALLAADMLASGEVAHAPQPSG
jgi:ferredoxin